MTAQCTWCMALDHSAPNCPKISTFTVATAHGIADPMHDEPDMSVVDRLHQLRAYCRGLLTDMRRAGVEPSPETKALTPALDSFDP